MSDPVNHPGHYTHGGIECIEAIEASMTADQFQAYCKGQVYKYLWRLGRKDDALQDAKKAQWYLSRMIEKMQE